MLAPPQSLQTLLMLLRWQMPAVLAFAPDAVMLADAGAPAVLALVLAAIMFALHTALLRCAHPPPLSLLLFPACPPPLLRRVVVLLLLPGHSRHLPRCFPCPHRPRTLRHSRRPHQQLRPRPRPAPPQGPCAFVPPRPAPPQGPRALVPPRHVPRRLRRAPWQRAGPVEGAAGALGAAVGGRAAEGLTAHAAGYGLGGTSAAGSGRGRGGQSARVHVGRRQRPAVGLSPINLDQLLTSMPALREGLRQLLGGGSECAQIDLAYNNIELLIARATFAQSSD